MPLPTAPVKRAALLAEQDYDVSAIRLHSEPRKIQAALTQQPPPPQPLAPKLPSVAPTKPRKVSPVGPSKLFVLDTNVLLHDPSCLFHFEEHDIFLPMVVLE